MVRYDLDKQARGDDSDMIPVNQGFCHECRFARNFLGKYTGLCDVKWDVTTPIEKSHTCSKYERYVPED